MIGARRVLVLMAVLIKLLLRDRCGTNSDSLAVERLLSMQADDSSNP